MADLDELEAKARAAKAATEGMVQDEWYSYDDLDGAFVYHDETAFVAACDPDTILNLIERVRAGTKAAWQFNEAVSLLREAHLQIPDWSALLKEIEESLPAIQAALESLAHSPQEAV